MDFWHLPLPPLTRCGAGSARDHGSRAVLNSAVIASKKETRKRGSEKPDRAEALMLAVAPEIPREVHNIMYYRRSCFHRPSLKF